MIQEFTVWQHEGVAAKLQFASTDGTIRGELIAGPEQRRAILNGRQEAKFEASFEFNVLTLHRNIG